MKWRGRPGPCRDGGRNLGLRFPSVEIRVDNRTPEWRAMLTKALALVAASAGGDKDDKPIYAEIIDADLELASRLELALNLADGDPSRPDRRR